MIILVIIRSIRVVKNVCSRLIKTLSRKHSIVYCQTNENNGCDMTLESIHSLLIQTSNSFPKSLPDLTNLFQLKELII